MYVTMTNTSIFPIIKTEEEIAKPPVLLGARDMGAQASPPAECSVYHPVFHIFARHCNFHFLLRERGQGSRIFLKNAGETPALPGAGKPPATEN